MSVIFKEVHSAIISFALYTYNTNTTFRKNDVVRIMIKIINHNYFVFQIFVRARCYVQQTRHDSVCLCENQIKTVVHRMNKNKCNVRASQTETAYQNLIIRCSNARNSLILQVSFDNSETRRHFFHATAIFLRNRIQRYLLLQTLSPSAKHRKSS